MKSTPDAKQNELDISIRLYIVIGLLFFYSCYCHVGHDEVEVARYTKTTSHVDVYIGRKHCAAPSYYTRTALWTC